MTMISQFKKRWNRTGAARVNALSWWRGAAFAVVSLGIAWHAASTAAAMITAKRAPQVALWFDADNPTALSKQADLRVTGDNLASSRTILHRMSRQSLRAMALNPEALRQYATAVGLGGDRAKMLKILALAQGLSRRDSGTQLLLLEEAIDANDAARALNHYDILLRTAPALREPLFDKLLVVVSNPELRQALAVLVKRNPNWLQNFVEYASYTAKQPDQIADLLVRAGPLPENLAGNQGIAQIIARTATQGQPALARRLYAMVPGAPTTALADPSLAAPASQFDTPPLSWELMENAEVSGQWVGAGQGRSIVAVAQPLASDIFARRLLFLKPGSYGLRFAVDLAAMAQGSEYLVETRCRAADGTESAAGRYRIAGRGAVVPLVVPDNCPAQWVEMKIKTPESADESIAVTTSVTLGR